MPKQPELNFDICEKNHGGNPESREAYLKNLRGSKSQRAEIVTLLFEVYERTGAGMTCEEIEEALSMRHQTASARVSELKALGVIRPSGDRKKTSTGSSAAVLIPYGASL